MRRLPLRSVFRITLEGRSSTKFLVGTIFSFSFSMAVILCTIGLMDGFEITLKKALAFANGDIKVTSRQGFFKSTVEFQDELKQVDSFLAFTPVLQVESFVLVKGVSKGVLIKGVEVEGFQQITGLDLSNLSSGVVVGSEFAKKYQTKLGDILTLAFASDKSSAGGSAILKEVEVQGIVNHGIFEKDMRFFYIKKEKVEEFLGYKENVSNLGLIKIKNFKSLEDATNDFSKLENIGLNFEPYWSEFDVLLNAVKVEKLSISLILQLIVIVAILNIVAFIFYISEVKSQDLFMLRALGLSQKMMRFFWMWLLFFIWGISVICSFGFQVLFGFLIENIPFLKIPGDVYVLSELKILIDPIDYLYVYGASLIWVMLIGLIMLKKMSKKSVLSSLRQEFS